MTVAVGSATVDRRVSFPLRAENFGRRYRRRGRWAVRRVDLELPAGSITALVGPNGAGKSTLIRSFMGFERPDEGRVWVEGIDPSRDSAAAVRLVGYVPQAASLYRSLSISDHFAFAASYRPDFDAEFASARMRDLELDEDRNIGTLSGGEQAQVALALALGTRTPVLLLDEPLASLDPLARRDFLSVLVRHVRSAGQTAVLSSHIVTDVEQACDRIVILSAGQLLLHASVADARATHRVVSSEDGTGEAVGFYVEADGRELQLIRSTSSELPQATLEEVVLGYLASGRPRRGRRS